MKQVVKVFLAFDNLYVSKDQANQAIRGREHKESVDTVYILLSNKEVRHLNALKVLKEIEDAQTDFLNSLQPYMYDSHEEAEQYINE